MDIDEFIAQLEKYKEKGYKTIELITESRAYGWRVQHPKIPLVFCEEEPTVIGIETREQ